MKSRLVLVVLVSIILASVASAQATRTWVSGVGDDVNPCSRTAPCKTFAGAISKTAAGGEISVLDPGGYGAVTITKSMTIDGKGQISSILAAGTNGVIINAAATDRVHLRNLAINGAGTGLDGVRVLNAGHVVVENVEISNFRGGAANSSQGVDIATAQVSPNVMRVALYGVTINSTNSHGVSCNNSSSGTVHLTVESSRVFDVEFSGIRLDNNCKATINNTVITGARQGGGVFVEKSSSAADVFDSVLSYNAHGVFVGNGGSPKVRLFGTQVTGNTLNGFNIVSGTVDSHGNNAILGNAGVQAPSAVVNTQ